MMQNITRCEECAYFKVKISIAPEFGIPVWETLECSKYKYHPYTARCYGGLCGAKGNAYKKIRREGGLF